MSEALSCPFCGKNNPKFESEYGGAKWGRIECGNCGAQGPDVRTEYKSSSHWGPAAIAEWNRREVKANEPA